MAKVTIPDSDKVITTKPVVEKVSEPITIKAIVKLQNQLDARLFYTGQVSGKSYIWERAGSIVPVDAQDAPKLLEKIINTNSCCNGSSTGQPVFIVVE